MDTEPQSSWERLVGMVEELTGRCLTLLNPDGDDRCRQRIIEAKIGPEGRLELTLTDPWDARNGDSVNQQVAAALSGIHRFGQECDQEMIFAADGSISFGVVRIEAPSFLDQYEVAKVKNQLHGELSLLDGRDCFCAGYVGTVVDIKFDDQNRRVEFKMHGVSTRAGEEGRTAQVTRNVSQQMFCISLDHEGQLALTLGSSTFTIADKLLVGRLLGVGG